MNVNQVNYMTDKRTLSVVRGLQRQEKDDSVFVRKNFDICFRGFWSEWDGCIVDLIGTKISIQSTH